MAVWRCSRVRRVSGLSRGRSMHGFALNVDVDLDFLDGFEEDAAVALLFGVGELEVGAGFVLVVGVGDFFLSERVIWKSCIICII